MLQNIFKICFVILFIGILGQFLFTPSTPQSPVSAAPQTQEALANEKLEETCKNWIFSRNRAYKLGREGDKKGSEKYRLAMVAFMKDLEAQYSEKQITATISRLEKSGYNAGF